ncbi:MAG: ABC transporter ATP-binding protein [Anaerolineaceae bacterium]|nr:ABC transporter ATP-binding protein [Anaerolineaceae bacterium]
MISLREPGAAAPALATDALLSVRDLQTYFFSREGTVKAVDGVSFDLKPGEILGIAGESGCGKTVTSQSILRILPKNGKIVGGEILFNNDGEELDLAGVEPDGSEMRGIRGKEIAMIFQEPMTAFSPVHTIGNQIIETIRIHQPVSKEEARRQAIEMLHRVGMPNPGRNIDQYTFKLSGGMRQRAMVALALSCQPKLLIADEPTTAVDVTIQAQILNLLREIQAELGMAIVMITHDLGVIAELTDRVMIMYLGKEVEYGKVADIYYRPQHPYTRGLLGSIPKLVPGRAAIEPIEGSVPSVYEMPAGCKFHPRCPHFMPGVCEKRDPPLIEVAPGHAVRCYLYGGKEALE